MRVDYDLVRFRLGHLAQFGLDAVALKYLECFFWIDDRAGSEENDHRIVLSFPVEIDVFEKAFGQFGIDLPCIFFRGDAAGHDPDRKHRQECREQ